MYCQVCETVNASEKAGVGLCGRFKQLVTLDILDYCECVVCVALDN